MHERHATKTDARSRTGRPRAATRAGARTRTRACGETASAVKRLALRRRRAVRRAVLLTGFTVTTAGAFAVSGPASAEPDPGGGAAAHRASPDPASDTAGAEAPAKQPNSRLGIAATKTATARGGRPPLRTSSRRMSKSLRMQQRSAERSLRSNGIHWRSSGNCSDRDRENCTSFERIRWGTIDGLIDFKRQSGCHVVVTGGTERGHAAGRHSHGNGYKIDIVPTPCVDRHIKRYDRIGTRSDGAALYRSPSGAIFARESDHWDITFH